MGAQCFQPVGGNRMRVIALDSCGTVKTGVGSQKVISDGFVSVNRTAEYEDPDEFIVKNANGDICLNYQTNPLLKWINLEITFCKVDPDIMNVLTGAPLVMDDQATPVAVGFRTRENTVQAVNFSLEVWTNLGGVACSGGSLEYGYYLVPWIVHGTIGDFSIENGALSLVVNARSKSGSPWGTGPFNIRNTKVSPAPAKLISAITSTDHEHLQVVNLAPPAAACGATTVTPDA